MRKRTVKQLDREIRKLTRRLEQLKQDRALLLLGIEPRNQLTIAVDPPAKPEPAPQRAVQLSLV
jgi:hypothetical protein